MRAAPRVVLAILLCLVLSVTAAAPGSAAPPPAFGDGPVWLWPLDGPRRVAEPYRAPAHAYGAGHRGVDLATAVGAVVRAPAAGVVAFRGVVVDRPLLTIDHGDGLVSTFEPLVSPLSPGDPVSAGEEIGVVDVGGHTAPGALHVGVRLDGEYVNPLLLFGAVERAVLLPCCDAIRAP
ncbi:murein hydrolase activator EnvC family protein [Microbacterium sp. 179-I 3D3 NHS]|uniref:murein hydrolase activator EnvC family protein n=1 Tax=Microbacterium sp. 179-I 3D3 NHS TaxID=3142382 RepID=UPI00399F0055